MLVHVSACKRRESQQRFTVTEEHTSESADPVIIKKYANRRLYNTQTSSYVTLDHLCEMVKEGVDFEVRDARTGEDITRSVLTQIIFEEEAKGQNLLPIRFLRQLIRLYGDSLQSFVPGYLDISMESFTKNQEAIKNRVAEAFGGGSAGIRSDGAAESGDVRTRHEMFSPFGGGMRGRARRKPGRPRGANGSRRAENLREISELKSEMKRCAQKTACRDAAANRRPRDAEDLCLFEFLRKCTRRLSALLCVLHGSGRLRPFRMDFRLAEMEALEIIDAEAFAADRRPPVRAHPFRDRLQLEVLGELDQRAHENLVVGRWRRDPSHRRRRS